MNKLRAGLAVFLLVLLTTFLTTGTAGAATAPTLGDADSFAVLAASTVTNTGPSEVYGKLGVSPGTSVTGFPPGQTVPPTLPHTNDQVAIDAQTAAVGVYNDLADEPCTGNLTGQNLGGLTLIPGVYCFDSSAFLTGTLTLNAVDGAASVFVFKTESTLITASDSGVEFIGAGTCNNVFWKVGSSATLGTNTHFEGTIVALTSITANTGATVNGRLIALNGAVTLDSNLVSGATCGIEDDTGTGGGDTGGNGTGGNGSGGNGTGGNGSGGNGSGGNGTGGNGTEETNTSTTQTGSSTTDETTQLTPPPNPATNPPTTGGPGTALPGEPKLITATHQQLVQTGINVFPLGLAGLTSLLLGAGCLVAHRRRTTQAL